MGECLLTEGPATCGDVEVVCGGGVAMVVVVVSLAPTVVVLKVVVVKGVDW